MFSSPSWPTDLAPLAEDYALVFSCQDGTTVNRRLVLRAAGGAWQTHIEYRTNGQPVAASGHAQIRHQRLIQDAEAAVSEAVEAWLPARAAERLGLHAAAMLEGPTVLNLRFAVDLPPPEHGGFLARRDPRDFSHITAARLSGWLRACAAALPPDGPAAWQVETVRGCPGGGGETQIWRVTARDAAGAAVTGLIKHRVHSAVSRGARASLAGPGGPAPLTVARVARVAAEGADADALGAAALPGIDGLCAAHAALFDE